jgi:hypothetical protein
VCSQLETVLGETGATGPGRQKRGFYRAQHVQGRGAGICRWTQHSAIAAALITGFLIVEADCSVCALIDFDMRLKVQYTSTSSLKSSNHLVAADGAIFLANRGHDAGRAVKLLLIRSTTSIKLLSLYLLMNASSCRAS